MSMTRSELESYAQALAGGARRASRALAVSSGRQRNDAVHAIADELCRHTDRILAENEKDVTLAAGLALSPAVLDRLRLDAGRIQKMARAVEEVAAQPDPVGETIEARVRPNGLRVEKRRVPMGVVAIIYEARPNVTSDAAALCLKSGNACILRGGKEALHANLAIGAVIAKGLEKAGLPSMAVQVVNTAERELVPVLLKRADEIDLVIPRGGESLIRAVVEQSRIPVIKHYTGNCHVYLHEDCPLELALPVVVNAKCQRPGVCNAAESLLVHAACAERLLPTVGRKLIEAGVEIRGCARTRQLLPEAKAAHDDDYRAEYLDLVISCKVVDSLEEAIEHINAYSSHHTDAILTHDVRAADAFVAGVDSANVMVNVSTRFSDGGEYGLGAEIGISTDKLHARGPMGAEDLTTYKWVVTGYGQLRQ